MPTWLAVLLTLSFVATLMVVDVRRADQASGALWIPVLWLMITGSRFVSQWMTLGQTLPVNYTDGSTIDAVYFLALILVGVVVLARRKVALLELIRRNPWLFAFCLFGLLSILWSDFPFIAFKRWVKTLGHPVVALIILTDVDPARAFRTVLKRCAYILVPFSILFIKYLPEYGRGFDLYTGAGYDRGVGLTKNDLGYVCMVFGVFFFWSVLTASRLELPGRKNSENFIGIAFFALICWLLVRSASATSLVTMLLGIATLLILGLRVVSKRYIGTTVLVGLALAVIAQATFDVYGHAVAMLGRDPSLTDRTEVWADAIALQPNVVVGAGFESFWLGRRLDTLWAKWWWFPTQAHNGYLETYLNLGVVGVVLLLGLMVSVFRKIARQLVSVDVEFARLKLAFFFAILAFNYTEAGFKGVHLIWTLFFIVAMEYPSAKPLGEQSGSVIRGFGRNPAPSLAGRNGLDDGAHGRTTSNRTALR